MALYPYLFKSNYKTAIWGGSRLASKLGRTDAPEGCSESWEVSAHPDGMSVIENGADAGRTLDALLKEYGERLVGSYAPESTQFPLLVKLIDATQRLSVQVHPDEESAQKHGGEPKTEMWYFLDVPPGAKVCAGFKESVGPRIFKDAVKQKALAPLLQAVGVEKGKAIFIPGGLVHAICEGALVLEVQQSSNTTYRVYDWDRVDANGKSRELHVREAADCINWRHAPAALQTPIPMKAKGEGNVCERILRSDFFTMQRYSLKSAEGFVADGTSMHIIYALEGAVRIVPAEGEAVELPFARSCLIPAAMGEYTVEPVEKNSKILMIGL